MPKLEFDLPAVIKDQCLLVHVDRPDLPQIVKGLLSTNGFQESDSLAPMYYSFTTQLSEQCSKQPHYDFGMRCTKRVLRRACQLLLRGGASPDEQEEKKSLAQASRDHWLKKLSRTDKQLLDPLIVKHFGIQQTCPDWEGRLQKWPRVAAWLKQDFQLC